MKWKKYALVKVVQIKETVEKEKICTLTYLWPLHFRGKTAHNFFHLYIIESKHPVSLKLEVDKYEIYLTFLSAVNRFISVAA